ncbi:protein ecdysoneless homolog isoform X1 [Abrus precatorius]|uniref:Protein ecdysoneless homolog isoform X1 n=1 Tax=Abrus precatorius TaxID=3816 RepID=A0A8B8LZH0_ABRPR|nr:protein ecdysoneless homolog isoform X1 [Abrus precatorius]
MEFPSSSSSSIFSPRASDDTVFYSIYPHSTTTTTTSTLQSLHLEILETVSPFTTDYIWQHQPFTLSISAPPNPSCPCPSSSNLHHLHGHLRYGDNLDDEWFTVFLLFHISINFPSLSLRVWDSDGDFLLIEAAFHLPRWLNPNTSLNRIFLRSGNLHIVPKTLLPSPSLLDSLKFIADSPSLSLAPDPVQRAIKNRIKDYPEKARKNMHRVRVRVPVSVAQVLKHEPCFISLAVEGFYDRDVDTMKFAARMERFLERGRSEELVIVSVKMSRAMYAQLVQQAFQAPKCYPEIPSRSEREAYVEAELGMKIACGLEMMYQQRKRDGMDGKGSTWEAFKKSLESSGYFQGLLPGSSEYQRLMQNAEEYYRNTSLHSSASELMNAPVRRIDEILALPHSADDFKGQEVPPSDDDSWLYDGEEELNSALMERQKEMDLYDLKHQKKGKAKEGDNTGVSSGSNAGEFDPVDIAKTMQAFVHKLSSYEGAEAPEDRNKEVNLDVDQFIKDMESIMKPPGGEVANGNIEEGSSSDLDFDDSDESDMAESAEDNEDGEDTFMQSYSDAMNEEINATTLQKSFVRANEQISKKDEGTSSASRYVDEEFSPVDMDVNLVKSFLDSFSSQQGLPGPASNLLGLMGVQLPKDASKGK